jgi:hypothetical protein
MSEAEIAAFIDAKVAEYDQVIDNLAALIRTSPTQIYGELPWSFPKGREDAREISKAPSKEIGEMRIALRELFEETKIDETMIDVYDSIKPYEIEYTDLDVKYHFKFYFATPNTTCKHFIDANDLAQTCEVNHIAFLSKTEFAQQAMCDITRTYILGAFDEIVEYFYENLDNNAVSVPADTLASFRNYAHGPTSGPVNVCRADLVSNWRAAPQVPQVVKTVPTPQPLQYVAPTPGASSSWHTKTSAPPHRPTVMRTDVRQGFGAARPDVRQGFGTASPGNRFASRTGSRADENNAWRRSDDTPPLGPKKNFHQKPFQR